MRRNVRGQRRIQNPVIYLGRSLLRKLLQNKSPLTIFAKRSILDVLQGSEHTSVGQRFVSV